MGSRLGVILFCLAHLAGVCHILMVWPCMDFWESPCGQTKLPYANDKSMVEFDVLLDSMLMNPSYAKTYHGMFMLFRKKTSQLAYIQVSEKLIHDLFISLLSLYLCLKAYTINKPCGHLF